MVIAVLAAGCAAPAPATGPPAVDDRTDVWFAQHLVPHLLQDISIADLTGGRLADPLARLAGRLRRREQGHASRLLTWLAGRGLAPHGHSHQRGDRLRRSDLERLSRLHGATLEPPARSAARAAVRPAHG
jgi:Domain of unknown function (DUF305)